MPSRFTSETTGWATVVAYDPGGTTGWAVMCVEPKTLLKNQPATSTIIKHYASGEITGEEPEQCDQIAELIDAWADSAVVGEQFTIRKFLQNREFMAPERINACIRWHLHGYGRPLFTQTPEMAKSKWDDGRLKRTKTNGSPWWVVGKDHARDGTRHAGLFIDRARAQPDLRGRAWPHIFNLKGELR